MKKERVKKDEFELALERVAARITDYPKERVGTVIKEHALGLNRTSLVRKLNEFIGHTIVELIETLRTRNVGHIDRYNALDLSGMHTGGWSSDMMELGVDTVFKKYKCP